MSWFEDRMIDAIDRGECSYEEAYDYVRDGLADRGDLLRKAERENAIPETQNSEFPDSEWSP